MSGQLLLNVPAEEYHTPELGTVSKSALDRVHKSPAHYRQWLTGPGRSSKALRFGKAFDCALLEPDVFAERYAIEPDFGNLRTKAARADRDAWRAEHDGWSQITDDDRATIEGMTASLRAHPLAWPLLSCGVAQATLRWVDQETGLKCRARPDYMSVERRVLVDLKTTQDASWYGFRRDIRRYRYHLQDALYRAGAAACGIDIRHFVFLAIEKEPPYAIALYTLADADVENGYRQARADIDTLAGCLERDSWPAYPETIQTITLEDDR